MSEYFQVGVVERSDRELVLRVEVIDGNPNAFHVERCFAVMLVVDVDGYDNPIAQDIARQLGHEEYDHDEEGLTALAAQYIDRVEIIETANLNPTATKDESGTIGWKDGDGIGSSATYRVLFTKASWIEHLEAGATWTAAAYDTSYGEEIDRDYEVAVVARDDARIVLRVKPIHASAEPVPDSARFALGVLAERARIAPRIFTFPEMEVQDDDEMIAAAPEYIESVARRDSEGDTVTLEVVVTDPEPVAAFEPGMRWIAYGFA